MTTLDIRRYIAGTDLPDMQVNWRDEHRQLLPFATDPYVFTLRVSRMTAPDVALIVKTSGFAVFAAAPNLIVSWATVGELHDLPVGLYLAVMTARRVSDGRTLGGRFQIQMLRGTVAAPVPSDPVPASASWLRLWAADPEPLLMFGAITRDANGYPTDADIVWPDGTAGTYTSSTGAHGVDAYSLTYGGRTVTQPLVTRDGSGNIIIRPPLEVS